MELPAAKRSSCTLRLPFISLSTAIECNDETVEQPLWKALQCKTEVFMAALNKTYLLYIWPYKVDISLRLDAQT